MASTLIVIDMQTSFHAAHNPYTLYGVVREIQSARSRKAGIVVVQYENGGCLMNQVERATRNYSNLDFVWKNQNDAGYEVYHSIVNNCFDSQQLTVCGVNTDCCVCETVETLSINLPYSKIEVVEDACNTDTRDFESFNWIKDLTNVVLREENNYE